MRGRGRQIGFSLLEVLLVMLLLGILLGMLTLATGPGAATQARTQGQALLDLLHAARQSALLQTRDYGVRMRPRSAQLLRHEAGGWRAMDAPLELSEGFAWRLQSAGLQVRLDEGDGPPQILLLSSDELTPFVLHLENARRRWLTISSDGLAEPAFDET